MTGRLRQWKTLLRHVLVWRPPAERLTLGLPLVAGLIVSILTIGPLVVLFRDGVGADWLAGVLGTWVGMNLGVVVGGAVQSARR